MLCYDMQWYDMTNENLRDVWFTQHPWEICSQIQYFYFYYIAILPHLGSEPLARGLYNLQIWLKSPCLWDTCFVIYIYIIFYAKWLVVEKKTFLYAWHLSFYIELTVPKGLGLRRGVDRYYAS